MGRLTNVVRLYLDTNIIIALGEGKGEVADLLRRFVARCKLEPKSFLCTSELTLAEVLVVPYRSRSDALIDRYDAWLITGSFMEVARVDSRIVAALPGKNKPMD